VLPSENQVALDCAPNSLFSLLARSVSNIHSESTQNKKLGYACISIKYKEFCTHSNAKFLAGFTKLQTCLTFLLPTVVFSCL
jgi:hypothetical protein